MIARDQNLGKPQVPGVIEKLQGPVTYLVRLDTGQLWKRHIDHLKEINGLSTETVLKTTETEVINVLYQLFQAIQTLTIMLHERLHHYPNLFYKTLQIPKTILLIQLYPMSLLREDIHSIHRNPIHGTLTDF